jgi:hypothetical protein
MPRVLRPELGADVKRCGGDQIIHGIDARVGAQIRRR